ncbi:uncharacterized protein LOC129573963 isoform X2 [Sitodiplosis mosellana]|uniref:uncharacterized protein LOC129573963 isoform X2 n=1 Tax=Sitodiplosis mosellana TaxID=263140 RepID=UPI002443A5FA|nr:uncharacterized protein LOC129573963 isoform X2 [Sitodiplosis mosellana]
MDRIFPARYTVRNSLRRIATNDDTEFSRESIVNLMEKFVKTVNVMDETILVPCRLMDRTVGDSTDTIVPEATGQSPLKHHHHHGHHSSNGKKKRIPVHEILSSAELFSLYNMLNGVKVDLLWGRNSEEQPEEIQNELDDENKTSASSTIVPSANSSCDTNANNSSTKDVKGHARRPSTASVASSNSATTLSDSDSEISTENDSGIESECKHETDKSRDLAKQYRKHLLGLYRCLEQMTDAANYLTARYQSDIGPV